MDGDVFNVWLQQEQTTGLERRPYSIDELRRNHVRDIDRVVGVAIVIVMQVAIGGIVFVAIGGIVFVAISGTVGVAIGGIAEGDSPVR
jgi:hypothetical protein